MGLIAGVETYVIINFIFIYEGSDGVSHNGSEG